LVRPVRGGIAELEVLLRYAIISDLHANIEALEATLARIDGIGADAIVCLGDVVGYNANPNECVELLAGRDILTILGNHDAVACELEEPWGFNPIALTAALWTRDHLTDDSFEWLRGLPDALNFGDFVAVHGAPKNHNTYLFSWEDVIPHTLFLEEQNCRLCFVGHTHTPAILSTDGAYEVDGQSRFHLGKREIFFVNPGSVGQPRDDDPRASFGLLDTDTDTFELLRVAYPVEEAAQRVLDARLPRFLADRLAVGR
jgi:diadenosine tetraphosphatase ApaH/serine/threonine PP2A family protein phosphatase